LLLLLWLNFSVVYSVSLISRPMDASTQSHGAQALSPLTTGSSQNPVPYWQTFNTTLDVALAQPPDVSGIPVVVRGVALEVANEFHEFVSAVPNGTQLQLSLT
jgi:hypothetical protein